MASLNGLPIFEALIDIEDIEQGMTCISLVDYPAIDKTFEYFDKKKTIQKFSILNSEQRIIRGCAMRANYPMYRYHPEFGEFYITFSKETIKEMCQKYLHNGFQNEFSLMHNGEVIKDIDLTQIFIKDTEKGISPVGFEDCAEGSLFVECKVLSDELWEKIKEGLFSGFSIECVSTLSPVQNVLFSKHNNNPNLESEVRALLNKLHKRLN